MSFLVAETPGNPFEQYGSPRDSQPSQSELPGVNAFDERNMPNRISKRKSVRQDAPDNWSCSKKCKKCICLITKNCS